ncbi:MAG: D-alanine--D-alanine ligase family protein [Erysipelotrichaceae bacterium]|nr:D-alanine--D-alanine ligase family protein [Erysipelotrichaceae bacterium]
MKINVGVIFGGESVEHEVSIISALQAINALDISLYNVIPLYISKQRKLYSSKALMEINNYQDLNKLISNIDEVYLLNEGNKVTCRAVKANLFSKKYPQVIDLVIPVIHGTNGEDGTVQGYLEMLRLPYVGCDVIAAGVGQDKVIMKYVLTGNGLPVCDWFWFYGHEFSHNMVDIYDKTKALGYPVIIKPACLGSSIGIQIVHNEAELEDAVNEATKYDRKLVVEKVIQNLLEINCSVLGDCYQCEASSLEQVLKNEEILSFADKYGGSKNKNASKGMASTSRIVPARISDEKTKMIKQMAIDTFKALGASGVCRIDFMIDQTNDNVYVNEINTIPGSLAFYLWQDANVSFNELMNRLVKQAIDRKRRQEKMIFSYETNILAGFSKGSKGSKK